MEIRHDLSGKRFVMFNSAGAETGSLVYDAGPDGNLIALSVHVSPELQGQGAAGLLLEELLAYARKNSLKIFPVCSYVAKRFSQNPDAYADVAR